MFALEKLWKYQKASGREIELPSFYLSRGCVCTCLVAHSCPTQVPLSMGILQARILLWVALPSSRGSSQSRDWTRSPTLQAILYHLSHQASSICIWISVSLPFQGLWWFCLMLRDKGSGKQTNTDSSLSLSTFYWYNHARVIYPCLSLSSSCIKWG